MSIDISVNNANNLPQFYSNIFTQSFDSFKISYILLLGIVVLVYILIFALFGNSTGSSGPLMIIIEIILWVVLIIVIGVNINNDKYNYSTTIKNLFNNEVTELDVNVTKDENIDENENGNENGNETFWDRLRNLFFPKKKVSCDNSEGSEVFHIPNNKHSYEQARSICSKFNARLATYSEVEDSYNKGANWCSYGWSEDQLALFPTQLDIYNSLKLIPGHENDCGRPGVNGGYIDNVNVRFGVNCYGKKPKETKEDTEYMERLKLSYSPTIDQDELDKIAKDKEDMLIAPFNKNKWSIQ